MNSREKHIATQIKYFFPQHNNLLNLYAIIMMVYVILDLLFQLTIS